MSIATTTGFSEQIVYNNAERYFFIFIVYVGNGLFALAFGLMAATSSVLPQRYEDTYETVQ